VLGETLPNPTGQNLAVAARANSHKPSCTTTTRTTASSPTGTHHGAQTQWPHTSTTRHAGVHAVRDQ
jgi:hypothetical protein